MSRACPFNYMAFSAVVLLLASLSFATLDVSLSDQGTGVRNKSSGELLETGNLTVSIWHSPTGGGKIYEETFVNAIVNGSWNVMLGENASNPLSLEFNKKYYRDYEINGEDADFVNLTGSTVERQFFHSPLGNVDTGDISDDAITEHKLKPSINISNATGYLWSNLINIPSDIADGDDTGNGSQWNITGSNYLINSSGVLELNETKLNATIDARAGGDGKGASGDYLYNDSSYIYFNDTKLNLTIDALDNDTLANLSCADTEIAKWNATSGAWECSQDSGSSYFAGGIYVYLNGSSYFLLNETKLNETINSLENDTLYYAGGSYIYKNSTNFFLLNETALNSTIDARAGGKGTSGAYLYNDSLLIYFNETRLNETIEGLSASSDEIPWTNDSSSTYIKPGYPQNAEISGNLTLGDLITMAFGETIDNLIDGWIRITGSLLVTGDINATGNMDIAGDISATNISATNVSADYYYGNGSYLTGITATEIADDSVTTGKIVDGHVNPQDVNNSESFNISGLTVNGNANVTSNLTIGGSKVYEEGGELVIDY